MSGAPAVTLIDFETEGIARRPAYPPKPVGVSIRKPGQRNSKYWAWGHPTENNCSFEDGRRALADAYSAGYPLSFQNGKFDVDVAETHYEMPRLDALQMHDTMFLIALHDPHADTFSLKPSAQRILGIAPEERDVLKEWIIANVPEAKRKPSEWGAYICRAPGKLVGKYANGDVLRTGQLFNHLWPEIVRRGMLQAYQREQRLMPVLLGTEREGIRCDLRSLQRDYSMYRQALGTADDWLRRRLKAPDLNMDADRDVAEAFDRAGIVEEWTYTPVKSHILKSGKVKITGGQRSVAKKNLTLDKFTDSKVAQVYGYRQKLATCLGTFFEPWITMAEASGGVIYTNWNQVRQTHGGDPVGARTGRLSSSPNFQNIPKDFEDNNEGWTHPSWLKALPALPLMRRYLIPDPGHVWIKRDYAQQELRILAHFEDGALLRKYNSNPKYDMHADVLDYCRDVAGLTINRAGVKILNFGDIYGMGVGELMAKAKIDAATAQALKRAKRAMMPDFDDLDSGIKQRAKAGFPIRTWGGREYYCEDPHFVEKYKRVMSFEYKMLNYLIQGSAADCTKEAVIRYYNHPDRQARFLLTVHDECNSSAPKERWKQEMAVLSECMESVEFDCPMLSDGGYGKNWCDLKECA